MALIYIVIKARKPENKPDKNVKSPKPKKDRKCEDRNNPSGRSKLSFSFSSFFISHCQIDNLSNFAKRPLNEFPSYSSSSHRTIVTFGRIKRAYLITESARLPTTSPPHFWGVRLPS